MKKKLFLCIAILIPVGLSAQNARLKYADKMYESMNYYHAANGYEDVLERGVDSAQIGERMAMSYDYSGNTDKAVEWYNYMEKHGGLSKEGELRSALLRRKQEDYEGSISRLKMYEQKYGPADVTSEMISRQSEMHKLKQEKQNFDLIETNAVNSTKSEMGVNYLTEDKLFIASNKRGSMVPSRQHGMTGEYFYNLYLADAEPDGTIGKELTMLKGKVNTKYHDGPAVYDSLNGIIYFTRDNFMGGKRGMDDDRVTHLKVYRGQLDGKKVKNVEELPFNSDDYSCGHPSISADGKTLYFASDMPGGIGGSDLYKVEVKQDGGFGKPQNLGTTVNTAMNELFPYIHPTEDLLFFSSEGHNGLGGLDVFAGKMSKSGTVKSIQNLGVPVNSPGDDFSFVNNAAQTKGYFASDRIGGEGSDDIYAFMQREPIKSVPSVNGVVKDLLTGTEVEGALVELKDKNGKTIDKVYTGPDGTYEMELDKLTDDFTLVASKDDYITAKQELDYKEGNDYEVDLNLEKGKDMDYYALGKVVESGTGIPLDNVQVKAINANSGEQIALVQTKDGNWRTPVIEEFRKGDDVQIDVKFDKSGYRPETKSVRVTLGTSEEIVINGGLPVEMSKEGSTADGDFVVLPIYFDFDRSNIRADAAVILDKLVKLMKEHPNMEIEFSSHTDSRGNDAYNMKLSERRAQSVMRYIVSKGIAKARIQGKGYGETQPNVSDTEIKNAPEEEREAMHQKNRRSEFKVRSK